MHLSGVAVLTAPLRFHLLSFPLSVPLHVRHVNRFAHTEGKHTAEKWTVNESCSEPVSACVCVCVCCLREKKKREKLCAFFFCVCSVHILEWTHFTRYSKQALERTRRCTRTHTQADSMTAAEDLWYSAAEPPRPCEL